MYINSGALAMLLQAERKRFLTEEWPRICATIRRLGLTPAELPDFPAAAASTSAADTQPVTNLNTNPPLEER
jgi:GntR family transcriptional regulator